MKRKKPCRSCLHGPYNMGCVFEQEEAVYHWTIVCSVCETPIASGTSPGEDFDAVGSEWLPDVVWEHDINTLPR
jgi:hypothetical protein